MMNKLKYSIGFGLIFMIGLGMVIAESFPATIQSIGDGTRQTSLQDDNLTVDAGGPYEGKVGEAIQFQGSVEGGQPPYKWQWKFGSGGTFKEQNPTHSYKREGTFTVTLKVRDDSKPPNTETATTTVTITGGGNGTLKVNISGPYNGSVGEEIQFNCTVEGGIPPYEYYWSFGDGTHSNESNPTHMYEREKSYRLQLRVKDSAQRVHIRHDFTWVYITA
jgi:PKD repeat protein